MNTPELLETTALLLLSWFLAISYCNSYSLSHLPIRVLQLSNCLMVLLALPCLLRRQERNRMMKNLHALLSTQNLAVWLGSPETGTLHHAVPALQRSSLQVVPSDRFLFLILSRTVVL